LYINCDPVYCMSSFVFCFSKLTQQLRCLVWFVSFVVVMCICLFMLFVVPYCITAATGLKTNLQSNNDSIQFNSIQFSSLLFMCRVNSHRANNRHSTVQIYITT
jgi:magnesium-transporting ATPase (P-type)